MGIEEGEEVQAKDIENTFDQNNCRKFSTGLERDSHILHKVFWQDKKITYLRISQLKHYVYQTRK
jgi:hypothetical protein